MAKKLTRKQKSKLNKAKFRASRKSRVHKKARRPAKSRARKSTRRTTRKPVRRTVRRARKPSRRAIAARGRKGARIKKFRHHLRSLDYGEYSAASNPRRGRKSRGRGRSHRRNPMGKELRDGTIISTSKGPGCTYVSLTSPYGETHEYEVSGSVVRLASAKTFAEAKRKLGGAMLRSINPKRRSSKRRSTKSRARKSTKRRSVRGKSRARKSTRRSSRTRRSHARR